MGVVNRYCGCSAWQNKFTVRCCKKNCNLRSLFHRLIYHKTLAGNIFVCGWLISVIFGYKYFYFAHNRWIVHHSHTHTMHKYVVLYEYEVYLPRSKYTYYNKLWLLFIIYGLLCGKSWRGTGAKISKYKNLYDSITCSVCFSPSNYCGWKKN